MLGILNFVTDTDGAVSIVHRLLDAVPSASPGLVSCSRRRPDVADAEIVDVTHFAGVGRKP